MQSSPLSLHVTYSVQHTLLGEAESTASDSQSSGSVHWGLVASGVCGIVLLLGLVAVVGLSMYAYRQRHKNRHRW